MEKKTIIGSETSIITKRENQPKRWPGLTWRSLKKTCYKLFKNKKKIKKMSIFVGCGYK